VFWLRQEMLGKCRAPPSLAWTLVEQMPALHLERELEEDELVFNVLEAWGTNTKNRLLFTSRPGRLELFRRPEKYLQPGAACRSTSRSALLSEFFIHSTGSVLTVKGPLWLKLEGKKAWKKQMFILTSSGIYSAPKERKSFSKFVTPPVCLVPFEAGHACCCYLGVGWKAKYKSPTDFCFAISKERCTIQGGSLVYFCTETEDSLREWLTGVRLVQDRERLWSNFHRLLSDLKERSQSPPASRSVPADCSGQAAAPLLPPTAYKATSQDIYSPSSESKSWDSGVCSISEVRFRGKLHILRNYLNDEYFIKMIMLDHAPIFRSCTGEQRSFLQPRGRPHTPHLSHPPTY